MSKLSPLQSVKKLHGTKDQLISKVLEMFTPAEGESREDYAKRLKPLRLDSGVSALARNGAKTGAERRQVGPEQGGQTGNVR